jgi:uncharacterized protein
MIGDCASRWEGPGGGVADAIAKRIIADIVAPHLRSGDFAAGVEAGVDAISARIAGEALPPPVAATAPGDAGFEELLVLGIIATIVVGGVLRAILDVFRRWPGVGHRRFRGLTLTGMMLIGIAGGLLAFVFVLAMGSSGARAVSVAAPGWAVEWGGGFGRGGGGGGWSGGGGFGGGGASGIGEHVCIAHPSTPADAALGSQPGVSITGSGRH